eukprot:scaffold12017_cov120-Isochrysis_galbana.AAC.13
MHPRLRNAGAITPFMNAAGSFTDSHTFTDAAEAGTSATVPGGRPSVRSAWRGVGAQQQGRGTPAKQPPLPPSLPSEGLDPAPAATAADAGRRHGRGRWQRRVCAWGGIVSRGGGGATAVVSCFASRHSTEGVHFPIFDSQYSAVRPDLVHVAVQEQYTPTVH